MPSATPGPLVETELGEDEFLGAFPEFTLTHVLNVATRDQLSIAIEALQAVQASGGALEALSLVRRGGDLDQRLTIVGIRPHQARLLASRLAALPGVAWAAVEHQILRR